MSVSNLLETCIPFMSYSILITAKMSVRSPYSHNPPSRFERTYIYLNGWKSATCKLSVSTIPNGWETYSCIEVYVDSWIFSCDLSSINYTTKLPASKSKFVGRPPSIREIIMNSLRLSVGGFSTRLNWYILFIISTLPTVPSINYGKTNKGFGAF